MIAQLYDYVPFSKTRSPNQEIIAADFHNFVGSGATAARIDWSGRYANLGSARSAYGQYLATHRSIYPNVKVFGRGGEIYLLKEESNA